MTTFDVAMEMITSGMERHEDGRTVQEVLADAILEAPLATLAALADMISDEATGLPSEDTAHTGKAGVPS
jgi:2-keto-4-pentenoate hydratase